MSGSEGDTLRLLQHLLYLYYEEDPDYTALESALYVARSLLPDRLRRAKYGYDPETEVVRLSDEGAILRQWGPDDDGYEVAFDAFRALVLAEDDDAIDGEYDPEDIF